MTVESKIDRGRTAMDRYALSRPMVLAVRDEVISEFTSVFDYGCGRGGDVTRLQRLGIQAAGWDPIHSPDAPTSEADVVSLNYVVNVIEHPRERADALRRAWGFARDAMVISARLEWERVGGAAFADGIVTSQGTFQKLFSQEELKSWIEALLQVPAVAAAPGVFYVFRREGDRQRFLASRNRRRPTELKTLLISMEPERAARRDDKVLTVFKEHEELLEPLMKFFARRGRLPEPVELENSVEVAAVFGSIGRAFKTVRLVTGRERWERVAAERKQDLLVYLGLANFEGRPRLGSLDSATRLDVRALFGRYSEACRQADELLFAAGDQTVVGRACETAGLGKLTAESLYLTSDLRFGLPPILRLYEGCARQLTGAVEHANILKLGRLEPRVSYLAYPKFDGVAHPELVASVSVFLPQLRVRYHSYRDAANPPILHRKELLISSDDPRREKFARLTAQEERRGLLASPTRIGTRLGWGEVLRANGYKIQGHRLVKDRRV